MSISLAPELEGFINQQVASGLYNSANEMIQEALKLLKERDEKKRRLEEFRAEINKGLASLDRGDKRPLDAEMIMAEGRRRLAAQRGNV